ncbi:MAG: TIGR04086 family membrane protein [Clostridiaceae bacterium]|nr:TIGR04086 family membrane protein [Clostridiaceae bacterium]
MRKPNFLSPENQGKRPVMKFAKSILTALIVSLALLVILSVIITYTSVPENAIGVSVDVISVFGVFLAGLLAARNVENKGWLYGLISGAIFMVLLLLIGYLVFDGVPFRNFNIFLVIMCLLSAVLGGMIGIGTKKGKK